MKTLTKKQRDKLWEQFYAELKTKWIARGWYSNVACLNELVQIIMMSESLCTSHEKEILEMRLHGATFEKIGKEFGVSKERIRQILSRIFQKICYQCRDVSSELYELKELRLKVNDLMESHRIDNEKYTCIEKLGLPYRTLNALINAGIGSIEHLCKLDEEAIYNLRGIGKIGIDEIKKKITEMGLSLSPSPFWEASSSH